MMVMACLFGALAASAPSVYSQDNVLKWEQIPNVGPVSWGNVDIERFNGQTYMTVQKSQGDAKAGLYQLNLTTRAWDKIIDPPSKLQQLGELIITPGGEIYSVGFECSLWRYNAAKQDWDAVMSRWRDSKYDYHCMGQGSISLDKDGQLLALAVDKKATNAYQEKSGGKEEVYQIIRITSDGKQVPQLAHLPIHDMGHVTFKPSLVQLADGTFVFGNSGEGSPKLEKMPRNIIMRFKDGKWETLNTLDHKVTVNGTTSGWSGAEVFTNEARSELYTKTGQAIYKFDFASNSWMMEDEFSFGGAPADLRSSGATGITGGFPWGMGYRLDDYLVNRTNNVIEGENCTAKGVRRALYVPELGSMIGVISTIIFEDCVAGYENKIADNKNRSLAELRADPQIIDLYNNRYLTNGHFADRVSVDRGVYMASLDDSKKVSRNIDLVYGGMLLAENKDAVSEPIAVALAGDGKSTLTAVRSNDTSFQAKHTDIGLGNTGNDYLVRTDLVSGELKVFSAGSKIRHLEVLPNGNFLVGHVGGVAEVDKDLSYVVANYEASSPVRKLAVSANGSFAMLLDDKRVVINISGGGSEELKVQNSAVHDIAMTDDRLYVSGYDDKTRGGVPVQVAFVNGYSYPGATFMWRTWGYNSDSLGADMADTRALAIDVTADGQNVYVAGESAGGNTIYRWNGIDLSTNTLRDNGYGGSGQLYMASSDAHILYVGAIDTATGAVKYGTINAAVLSSQQRYNTTKVGDIVVTDDEKVIVTGVAAARLARRSSYYFNGERVNGGDNIEGYNGGDAFVLVLDKGGKRDFWYTPSHRRFAGDGISVAANKSVVAMAASHAGGVPMLTSNSGNWHEDTSKDSKENKTPSVYLMVAGLGDEVALELPTPPTKKAPALIDDEDDGSDDDQEKTQDPRYEREKARCDKLAERSQSSRRSKNRIYSRLITIEQYMIEGGEFTTRSITRCVASRDKTDFSANIKKLRSSIGNRNRAMIKRCQRSRACRPSLVEFIKERRAARRR